MENYLKRFVTAETAVFWDVDGCQIHEDGSAIDVSQKIRSALKQKNCLGTMTIYAYGDTYHIQDRLGQNATMDIIKKRGDTIKIEEMDYRGTAYIYADEKRGVDHRPAIVLNHTSREDKDVRLKKISVDLLCWAIDNPGPANLMIIVDDISTQTQFVRAIQLLSSTSYNVLLVLPQTAPPQGQLLEFLREKWLWERLSKDGEFINIPKPSSPEPLDNTSTGNTCTGKPIWFLLAGAGDLVSIVFSRLQRSH